MDRDRFCKIWIPLGAKFYQVAFYILESEAMAQDAVQDLYMRLWKVRDRLEGILHPEAYGITMLKNLCLDRIRHAAVARSEPLDRVPETADPDPPPDRLLADREALERLELLVERLPDKQRTVWKLRMDEGLEYGQIAERTGWSGIHLRVLLSSARKTLRKQMEEWK